MRRSGLVAFGGEADMGRLPKSVAADPKRQFVTINYRIAKGSFALMLGAPGQLQSLAGQEHGRTIPLATLAALQGAAALVILSLLDIL
jgi:hypothetical protein